MSGWEEAMCESSQFVQKKPLNAKMYLADNVVSTGTATKT